MNYLHNQTYDRQKKYIKNKLPKYTQVIYCRLDLYMTDMIPVLEIAS